MKLIILLPFVALVGCSSTMFDRKLDGVFGIERDDTQVVTTVARIVSLPLIGDLAQFSHSTTD